MITLITGGPGTGKTAWLLNELLDLRQADPDRLLFIHGIRNLRGLAHEQIFCRSQLCDICRSQDDVINARSESSMSPKFVEEWPNWAETGSLIIVDEVQRIWRPQNGSQAPHVSISQLETHRHYGLDFWLISQGPHLFHNFIRLLVGRHIHLVAKWSGRYQYEWPECSQNVQSRTDAVERLYKLPKRVYDLYDSAELHTKQPKRAPMALYLFVVLASVALLLVYNSYWSISSRTSAKTPSAASVPENPAPPVQSAPPPLPAVHPVPVATMKPPFYGLKWRLTGTIKVQRPGGLPSPSVAYVSITTDEGEIVLSSRSLERYGYKMRYYDKCLVEFYYKGLDKITAHCIKPPPQPAQPVYPFPEQHLLAANLK